MTRILLPLFLISFLSLQAQFSFTNRNDLLVNTTHSGVAMGVGDMNGDGLDDLIRLDQGTDLYIEYQTAPNAPFTSMYVGNMANSSQWSLAVADVDNNGYCDFMCGGAYDGVKLAMANANGTSFQVDNLPGPGLFVQGSNFADINNDGWLDYFACHDDAESRIWGNDGTGNFVEQDSWIDMATTPTSDNSGNYGSVWSDFDRDGDLDLYIAKCRQGVTDPTDPRRVNALFVNDGAGNFTEAADMYGLKIGAQSWTADFADIDNDGDWDCFVTNHDVPSQLLLNDGNNNFTDITASSGLNISVVAIQGVFHDFDNDGFVDVLITGGDSQIFKNNGDNTFTEIFGLFDNNEMESFAVGDLNHDGFLDIYGGYATIYTNPSNIDDVLWMNDGANGNNFLSVNLQGVVSNRDGIGALLEIHGDWGVQIREVRAGESYGICNSFQKHFGLGTAASIDSLKIYWPSGTTDTYVDLNVNQFINVLEGQCISPNANISADGPTTICSGESVNLSAPAGFNYLWSNNETSQSIAVNASGFYNVTITDMSGCPGISQTIEVIVDPDETPEILIDGDLIFCEGGSVELSATNGNSFSWSNNETTQSINATQGGTYTVTIQGQCEDFTSAPVDVDVKEGIEPTVTIPLSIQEGSSVELIATGDNPQWFTEATGGSLVGLGNSFITPALFEDITYWVSDLTLYGGAIDFGAKPDNSGSGGYPNSQDNGLYFEAYEPFTIVSVKMYAGSAADRDIWVEDDQGNVLMSTTVSFVEGEQRIDLDFDIPGPGIYYIRASGSQLFRNDSGVQFPYPLGDVGQVTLSTWGPNWYYYFYDWEVQKEKWECESDRVPVEINLLLTNINNIEANALTILPNPNNGIFNIELSNLIKNGVLNVYNANGQMIQSNILDNQPAGMLEMDLSDFAKGFYWIQIQDADANYTGKIIIQ